MILKVDFRESQFFDLLKDAEKVNLHLGDFEICDDAGTTVAIIERKTIDDLASSIKDGRYKEQCFRLSESISNVKIFYFLEGATIRNVHQAIPKATLVSAIFSLSAKYTVVRTTSVQDTAEYILALMKKLGKTTTTTEDPQPCYSTVVKSVKKDNICPENFGEIVLCQIPGVSNKTSKTIMDHYKTLNALMADAEKTQVLSSLCISKRKISKSVVDNIVRFLETM
jgi:ERCC4-type nuclease